MVLEIEYSVDSQYNQDMFDSCKDVTNRAAFTPAIGLMCGAYGAELCTAQRWFEFLGSSTKVKPKIFSSKLLFDSRTKFLLNFFQGLAPFDINYKFYNDSAGEKPSDPAIVPYKTDITPCSQGVNGQEACSCTDCKAVCPGPPGVFASPIFWLFFCLVDFPSNVWFSPKIVSPTFHCLPISCNVTPNNVV